MKHAYLSLTLLLLLLNNNNNVYAQTNTTLSNLQSPTAINQSLLPNGNKMHDLGSPALYWKDLYTDRLFLRGQLVIHTPGTQNLFFGNAGITSLAGKLNTGLGYLTLRSLTTGSYNTASGVESMFSTNTGSRNTGTGYRTMYANITGSGNTANGFSALYYNEGGSFNTAIGSASLYENTEGTHNTAIGYVSLQDNITGHNNTGVGSYSLFHNKTGSYNVAIGGRALYDNNTGVQNIAIGYEALMFNSSGASNTANGYGALRGNVSGSSNTANGSLALNHNFNGRFNTASGAGALTSNTRGSWNTANGYYAMALHETGDYNTAGGAFALYSDLNGAFNTAYGNNALVDNSIGYSNTAIGSNSLSSMTQGALNTALGAETWMLDNISNAVAIGSFTAVYTSNQVRIGNTAVTSIGGPVGWTTISDGRYKKNIQENIAGLVFINKLRPVSYTMDIEGLNNFNMQHRKRLLDSLPQEARTILNEAAKEAASIVYDGFVAQEVEAAGREINFAFSGVDKPKSENGFYGLRYDHFVVPLVKAVQELSRMNDSLRLQHDSMNKQVNALRQQNIQLAERLEKLETILNTQNNSNTTLKNVTLSDAPTVQQAQLAEATLEQNIPNPFGNSTTIPYTLPQKYTTAQLIITDPMGKQLKQVTVSGTGKGMLTIDASTLSAGTYQYSLIVNGKLIGTRKMILNK